MDYQCSPDLKSDTDLTVDALSLYARFRQVADDKYVDDRLDAELTRHVRLCELVCAYYARSGYYWAVLPMHSFESINVWAIQHFRDQGFMVEHQQHAEHHDAPDHHDKTKKVRVTTLRSEWVVKWLTRTRPADPAHSAEWRRREKLEDEDTASHPPVPVSIVTDGNISETKAIWAALLDQRFLVEVQRIHRRHYLCIFEAGACRHFEETNVAFSAMFGPDCGDVDLWGERAQQLVDGF